LREDNVPAIGHPTELNRAANKGTRVNGTEKLDRLAARKREEPKFGFALSQHN
jgi:hypothetical protein